MSNQVLIKGGSVIDPNEHSKKPNDILIKDGMIAEVGLNLNTESRTSIIAVSYTHLTLPTILLV